MSAQYFTGDQEFFTGIGAIRFEGPRSDNPLAFKFYDPAKKIAGKTMKEHLRFAIAYWHSFCADGADPFGRASHDFPWNHANPMTAAHLKAQAAFEFFTKIGAPYYCFHDADVAPEGDNVDEYQKNYWEIARIFRTLQDKTGVKLLWNTANLFSHPRYMNGAATNPDFNVVARAALQIQTCLDVNVFLGGEGYTFWGGREGYMSLWNTDMKREAAHMGTFLRMARDYGRRIGFSGAYYIEPKPMEPSKHQYDYDAATSIGFIKEQGLEKDFRLNIENNHATLAGHTFAHELQVASDAGLLGSVDANQGDAQNGWDTDEFPCDVYQTVEAMMVILRSGGFTTGGLNFDAKRRRNSTDMEDLFIAHILGFDTFALGLTLADRIISDGVVDDLLAKRYSSFDSGSGADFEKGKLTLEQLAGIGKTAPQTKTSGKQEYIQSLVNQYLFG
ncbi:xylose isomerase [Parasphaerochaeta coccoides]|uniref:Xylose isomerase n=1 Tax=Parasphaerochaeta coccoides (strain ATCC BAA-1237 / DSM 17374 / SPN1) TaxID=760011 RepID=F4GJW9_PARC1|nr:xylose isomerase [Parasphaerochaeta coccoides]AEC01394.1 D-xylose isomerase [Parasphaerochaeta coccoides DSM 17374]